MDRQYKVFICATSDLADDRLEAIRAVQLCGCTPCAMEHWSSGPTTPRLKISDELRSCHFMVMLVGDTAGSLMTPTLRRRTGKNGSRRLTLPKTQRWIDFEYQLARENGIPVIPLLRRAASKVLGRAKVLRDHLRGTHLTRTYTTGPEIREYVMSGLSALIRSRERAIVLESNAELIHQVTAYLEAAGRTSRAKQATLVQFSAQNAKDIVRALLWRRVKTRLYLADPGDHNKYIVNDYQRARVISTVEELANNIDPPWPGEDARALLKNFKLFYYTAPGALRIVQIDDGFIAVGAFAYMWKRPRRSQPWMLDIRGGELPMILFLKDHAGFDMISRSVRKMLSDWEQQKKVIRRGHVPIPEKSRPVPARAPRGRRPTTGKVLQKR